MNYTSPPRTNKVTQLPYSSPCSPFDGPKAISSKFNFDNVGSPIRKTIRNASNESLEDLRRAPRKDYDNMPEDRKYLYGSVCKQDRHALDFSPSTAD